MAMSRLELDGKTRGWRLEGHLFFNITFICLAVLGVSCGIWDLRSLFWLAGFLAEALGSSALTRNQTLVTPQCRVTLRWKRGVLASGPPGQSLEGTAFGSCLSQCAAEAFVL